MSAPDTTSVGVPRIVPTETCIRALRGTWELRGELFVLEKEPETGVLIASTADGQRVNPIPIITMGKKVQGWESH
jgi:hypothetical protein